MTTIAWPSNVRPGAADFGIEFDVQLTVMRSGRVNTFGLPGARWVATITFDNDHEEEQRPRVEALILSLKGGANQLAMPHFGRPIPRGTLRGSPTLGANVPPGAEIFPILNATGSLLKGDIIGVGGQLLMVVNDAFPANGRIDVQVSPSTRRAYSAGTAVVWNRPTCLWIPKTSTAGPFPYRPNMRPGFSIELVEAA
jgi:hypothetical protein